MSRSLTRLGDTKSKAKTSLISWRSLTTFVESRLLAKCYYFEPYCKQVLLFLLMVLSFEILEVILFANIYTL